MYQASPFCRRSILSRLSVCCSSTSAKIRRLNRPQPSTTTTSDLRSREIPSAQHPSLESNLKRKKMPKFVWNKVHLFRLHHISSVGVCRPVSPPSPPPL